MIALLKDKAEFDEMLAARTSKDVVQREGKRWRVWAVWETHSSLGHSFYADLQQLPDGVKTGAQLDADVARLMAMSEAEIDAELRSMGMEPAEAERQGKAAVEGALAAIRERTPGVPVTTGRQSSNQRDEKE